MGYARHIGRVGALAVTLGVGVAIANTPGIAYADPSGSSPAGDSSSTTTSSSTSMSSPTKKSSSTSKTSAGKGAASADGDDVDSSASDRNSVSRSAARSIRDRGAGNTTADDVDDTLSTDVPPAQEEDETQKSASGDLADRKASNTSKRAHTRIRSPTPWATLSRRSMRPPTVVRDLPKTQHIRAGRHPDDVLLRARPDLIRPRRPQRHSRRLRRQWHQQCHRHAPPWSGSSRTWSLQCCDRP